MSWNPQDRAYSDPEFWAKRLKSAQDQGILYKAVFSTDEKTWLDAENDHKRVLQAHIWKDESILDVACGWGRLLDLMPGDWTGSYFGFDITPAFIKLARDSHPGKNFTVMDARDLSPLDGLTFDWAICISFERGIIGKFGQEVWDRIERELLKRCKRLLSMDFNLDGNTRVIGG